MVVMKANPKQGRATAENDLSYLRSSYLLGYMMAVNHAFFEGDRVFGFYVNACHLKQVITECVISTFKYRQFLSSMHIFAYYV